MMIYWIGILSILIAIESVFAGTYLSMLFPPHPAAWAVQDLFTTYQHVIFAKYDVFFLRLFIIVGLGSFILLMRIFTRITGQKYASFKYFILLQAAIVITETFFL